jgi:hypothetical protein
LFVVTPEEAAPAGEDTIEEATPAGEDTIEEAAPAGDDVEGILVVDW